MNDFWNAMFSKRKYDFFLQCNVFIEKTANPCYVNLPKVFLHQNKRTKSYSKSRHHLYRKIGSVMVQFTWNLKKKTISKAVHTVGSHFQVMVWTKIYMKRLRNISGSNWRNFKKHWTCLGKRVMALKHAKFSLFYGRCWWKIFFPSKYSQFCCKLRQFW